MTEARPNHPPPNQHDHNPKHGHDPNHGHGSDQGHDHGQGHGHGPGVHVFTVSVNEQPVTLTGEFVTGAEIKVAAIREGVRIEPNFVLQEELPNGTSKVIGDQDSVRLREHLRFTAIAPDDNS